MRLANTRRASAWPAVLGLLSLLVRPATATAAGPTVTIDAPATGSIFFAGDPIVLQARAADGAGGDLGAAVVWTSDLQGTLGTGSQLPVTLGAGVHTLTASVTDGLGGSAADQVGVRVGPRPAGNTEPLVTILAPLAGQHLVTGSAALLRAAASDLEDGNLAASLLWTSDRDGALGTGATLAPTLSQGIHQLTASVVDAGGLRGTATVGVEVAPSVAREFPAAADTYVDAASPAMGFGASPILRIDANTARHTYLRFVVGGIGARPVMRAVLRLQVDAAAGAESDSGGTLYALPAGGWDDTATYATRPAIDGPPLASAGPVARGGRVELDVTPAVTGEGPYDFALVNASVDEATYRSREGGAAPTLVLTLPGTAPAVTITAPADPAVAVRGETIFFSVQASDAEDGDLSASLVWSSSRDGLLGSGSALGTSTLSVGTHTIAATATDSDGAAGTATLQLTVLPSPLGGGGITPPPPANAPPTLSICAPAGGTALLAGRPLLLGAMASDAEDGDVGALVRWTSSRDGALGAGAMLLVPQLSAGTHTLSATVTDYAGASGSASLTVTVVPPRLTFSPTADTYVDAAAATTAFGSATDLGVGTLPASRQAFLRFAVSGLGGFSVQQALLRLTVGPGAGDGGSGGTLRAMSDGAWSEATTTYATRPMVNGPAIASRGAVAPGQLVDFDATAAVVGEGTYGFALTTSASTDPVRYLSREAAVGGPQLVLTLTQNTPPVVAIHAPPPPLAEDVPIALTGTAADAESGDVSGRLVWTSNLDGPLGTGASLIVRTLRAGTHLVTAVASDDAGSSGQARVTLQVAPPNQAPDVVVIAPGPATTVRLGVPLVLSAIATDDTDGNLSPRIAWSSNRDGALGTGATRTVVLSQGTHTIAATATDGGARTGQAQVTVAVDAPPTLAITGPGDGASFVPGTPITFTAVAADVEDGDLGAGVTWTSSLDGPLGSGARLVRATLHAGTHRVTASVADYSGATASAAVTVVVNTPPTLTITTPPNGATFAPGDVLTLAATATDAEDGNLAPTIVWSSSVDGVLGTGGLVTAVRLSPAIHTLTATVLDAAGVTTRASIMVSPFGCLGQTGPLQSISGTFVTGYVNFQLEPAARLDLLHATYLASAQSRYPINVDGGAGLCIAGGTVLGQYDRNLSWDAMHYDNNNAAVAFASSGVTIDSVRIDNVTDGIRPTRDGGFTLRNSRLSYVRDDCVENDHLQDGLVDDSLLDGCYVAFSARPSQAIIDSGFNGADKIWTIRNSLVRLQPMPGPPDGSPDGLGHGGFFKWHLWDNPLASLSPKLALHGNVFMAERVGQVGGARMGIPPGKLASCSNNVMVWLGPGAFPAELPAECFTVTTDRGVWDAAVADWLRRHPQVGG